MGADLLVNDAPAPDGESTSRRCLSARTKKLWAFTGRRLVPLGEYVPLRFSAGSPATARAAQSRQRGAGPVVAVNSLHIAVDQLRDDLLDLTRHAAAQGGAAGIEVPPRRSKGVGRSRSLAAQPRGARRRKPIPAVHILVRSSAFDTQGRRLAWCSANSTVPSWWLFRWHRNVTLYASVGDWVPVTATPMVMGAGFAVFLRRSGSSVRLRG